MNAPEPASASPRRELHASAILVLVTLFWGISFPLMKDWQDAAVDCPGGIVFASAIMIAMRMGLALLILAVFRRSLFQEATRREHAAGAWIGLAFFIGFLCQVVGLAYITAGLSGFLTSLVCVWVPLLGWLGWRVPVARITLLGIGVGLAGTAILVLLDPKGLGASRHGALLTLIASVLFAVQVVLLDRLGRHVNPAHLTPAFFGVTGLVALGVALLTTPNLADSLHWTVGMLEQPGLAIRVLVLTVFSTVLAFHWMNIYQPRVPAGRAAIIYLLEPVFASMFAILLGQEGITLRLIGGGGVILLGNLLVELPGILRLRKAEALVNDYTENQKLETRN